MGGQQLRAKQAQGIRNKESATREGGADFTALQIRLQSHTSGAWYVEHLYKWKKRRAVDALFCSKMLRAETRVLLMPIGLTDLGVYSRKPLFQLVFASNLSEKNKQQ